MNSTLPSLCTELQLHSILYEHIKSGLEMNVSMAWIQV